MGPVNALGSFWSLLLNNSSDQAHLFPTCPFSPAHEALEPGLFAVETILNPSISKSKGNLYVSLLLLFTWFDLVSLSSLILLEVEQGPGLGTL